MKVGLVKIAKIGTVLLTIGTALLTSWVSGKENEKILAKLVDEKLGK